MTTTEALAPTEIIAAFGQLPVSFGQGRAFVSLPIGTGYLGGTVSLNLVADHDEVRRTVTVALQRWVSDPANRRRAQIVDRHCCQTRVHVEGGVDDPTQAELVTILRRGRDVLVEKVGHLLVQAILIPVDDQDVFRRDVVVHRA